MAHSPTEGDIFIDRMNVALAKAHRAIALSLPPRTITEAQSVQTEEEIEKEEQDFAPDPESLGLGNIITKDGDVREDMSSNGKLRKQLLGRGYTKKNTDGKGRGEQKNSKSGSLQVGSMPHTIQSKQREEDESEDDGGRSSLGKSKHSASKINSEQNVGSGADSKGQLENALLEKPVFPPRPPKRAINYLDEVLADRSRKKQKTKKKIQKAAAEANDNV